MLINPIGEYAVNDDWDFFLHVEYFSTGQFIKNALIDSTFLLQGLMGTLWAKLFGLSFTSLRFLTILISVGTLIGIERILSYNSYFQLNKATKTFFLLLIAFNPLFYTSTFSFMTENYFLFFLVWATYFFLKYLEAPTLKNLILSVLFAGACMLIRQFGVVVAGAVCLFTLLTIVTPLLRRQKYNSLGKKAWVEAAVHLVFPLAVFLEIFAITMLWPKVSFDGITATEATGSTSIVSAFLAKFNDILIEPEDLKERMIELKFLLPYLGYFLAPISFVILLRKKVLMILMIGLSASLLVLPIFNIDIFALGNVFFVEGLYFKTDYRHYLNIFDNISYKMALSYLISVSLVTLAFTIVVNVLPKFRRIKAIKLTPDNIGKGFILTLAIGMFLLPILSDDFLDRYFLNFFVMLVILYASYIKKPHNLTIRPRIVPALLMLLLIAIHIIFIQWEFSRKTVLTWDIARKFQERYELNTNIYVDGAFIRFYHTRGEPIFLLEKAVPQGVNFVCFVQRYTIETDNWIEYTHDKLEQKAYPIITNPEIYEHKDSPGYRRVSRNLEKLEYNEQYHSPMYNVLGFKTFVGGFCDFEREEED